MSAGPESCKGDDDVFIYSKWRLKSMVNTKIMALVAILALAGTALPLMSTEASAQGNMTENMTEGTMGNMTEGGNMTADSGNISGIPVPA